MSPSCPHSRLHTHSDDSEPDHEDIDAQQHGVRGGGGGFGLGASSRAGGGGERIGGQAVGSEGEELRDR